MFLFIYASISHETVIDNTLSLTLPAAVYTSSTQDLTFEYPDIFKAYTEQYSGEDILYHVNLLTNTPEIHGYVEVWNLNEPLSVFLEKAKASFSPSIRNFKESFPSNNINLREWSYDVDSDSGEIHGRQHFSAKDNKLIVTALFAPTNVWSSKYDSMFEEIKSSAKLLN